MIDDGFASRRAASYARPACSLVVLRRAGDARITGDPTTLDGRTVAIIADPAAEYRAIVERWQGRADDWGLGPADFLPGAAAAA